MVVALVTVYHPREAVLNNLRTVAGQVDALHICDNTPTPQPELFASLDCHYHGFGENLGISAAFNRVLKSPEYGWQPQTRVIFFDQDSSIAPGHVQALTDQWQALESAGIQVGVLGPEFFNTSNGTVERPRRRKPVNDRTYRAGSVITSSLLTTYGALQAVDFWDERVFLDLADWDLCWRLARAGYGCFMTDAAVLHHSLGCGEKKVGPLHLRVGAPYREYYEHREGLYLLFRRHTPLYERIRFLAMVGVRTPLHLMFFDQKKARWRYIRRGIADFFRKKQGALPEHNKPTGGTK